MTWLAPRVLAFLILLLFAGPDGFAAARAAAVHASFRAADGQQVGLTIWGSDPVRPGRPATVFFHGGGWIGGKAWEFGPLCRTIVARGMVCISVTYTLPAGEDVLGEGAGAVAWTRTHAQELGIDPRRIAAGGASVGGYLAASTAILPEPEGNASRPDALILLNPVVRKFGSGPAFNLTDELNRPLPPTLIIHGTADRASPIVHVERFAAKAKSLGSSDVQLIEFPGREHNFWNFRRGENPDFDVVKADVSTFLDRLGWK